MKRISRYRARAALLIILSTAVGAVCFQAAEQPAGGVISLKECLASAVKNNPSAASALYSGRASNARIGSTKSAYYPTVNFSGDISRSYSEQPGEGRGSFTGTSSSASVGGQYTIWDSGERKANLSGAVASYESSDARYMSTLQDLALSVESAYYTVQGAMWALQIAEETLKQSDFHLEMATARNSVGLAPRSDVLKAATAQADSKLQVITAGSALDKARSNLAVLMGLPADTPVQVEEAKRGAELPPLPDWKSGWESGKSLLPEIRAAVKSTDTFKFAYDAAVSSYLPIITADASVGRRDSGAWPELDQWSVGLNLRVPIFTGFARKYQILQARESWEGSKADLRSTVLSSEKAAYDARIALNQALRSVEAAEAYLASAQENSDVAEGQYKNGLGAMLDVVDAATELSSAKLRLISARLSVATARASWERATGKNLLEGIDLPSSSAHENDGDSKP